MVNLTTRPVESAQEMLPVHHSGMPKFLVFEASKLGGQENGVQHARVARGLLGLENAVVEGVKFDEDEGALVTSVRPSKGKQNRCGLLCPERSPEYDKHSGRRRWRALGLSVGVVRDRRAAGHVQGPWRGRCRRSVGSTRRGPYPRVRGAGGVTGDEDVQELGHGADAGCVEDAWVDRRTGLGLDRGAVRPVRGPDSDRVYGIS